MIHIKHSLLYVEITDINIKITIFIAADTIEKLEVKTTNRRSDNERSTFSRCNELRFTVTVGLAKYYFASTFHFRSAPTDLTLQMFCHFFVSWKLSTGGIQYVKA